MNLQEETNVEKLKAIAYDEVQKLNIAQNNIQMLNQRIAQLQEEASHAAAETLKKPVKA